MTLEGPPPDRLGPPEYHSSLGRVYERLPELVRRVLERSFPEFPQLDWSSDDPTCIGYRKRMGRDTDLLFYVRGEFCLNDQKEYITIRRGSATYHLDYGPNSRGFGRWHDDA